MGVGDSPDQRVERRVREALAAAFAACEELVEVRPGSEGADLVVSVAERTFAVVVISAGSAAQVAKRAGSAADAAKQLGKRALPLVAAPFMSEAGKRACERAGVAWFDFSGNANIIAPGLRIIIDGRPNRFRRRGRPASVFAPKSARVARWLLMHPGEAISQRELAHAIGISEGFVSRIVGRLRDEHYVVRDAKGALRVADPQVLLDAWQEQYDFSRHTIIQGHVAARSGDALARFVSDTLHANELEYAATGLAAAWQLTHFAAFRIATFFVEAEPSAALHAKLGFRNEPRGANLWFVVPNDVGVFQGAGDQDGLRCVHPVQVYLDLKGHPERSAEAAGHLRSTLLGW